MLSKPFELIGLGIFTYGFSKTVSFPAGLMFAGAAIVLIGSVTDDKAVGMALRRGTSWIRYAWWRQLARENGEDTPPLFRRRTQPVIPCDCGGQEDCPVCDGLGYVPDPDARVGTKSPHPPIRVNPQTEALAQRLGRAREERARLHDRTPALSRQDYGNGDGDLERLA